MIKFLRTPLALSAGFLLTLMAPASSIAAPLKIMPVGDSITEGFHACSYRKPLVESLASCDIELQGDQNGAYHPGHTCLTEHSTHSGFGGWQTFDFLSDNGYGESRIEGYISDYTPDVVLLHIGSNDMYYSSPPGTFDVATMTGTETIGRVNDMINKIYERQPDATVFVASLIPWLGESYVDEGIDLLRIETTIMVNARASAGDSIVLVDVNSGFTADMLHDGVHPNEIGEQLIASRFKAAMQSNGYCAEVKPEIPEPVSPAAKENISENTGIEFIWNEVNGATKYDFFVYDRANKIRTNKHYSVNAESVCTDGICKITSTEAIPYRSSHRWYVRAFNEVGKSKYIGTTFTVTIPFDSAPVIEAPAHKQIVEQNSGIEFIWLQVEGAIDYDFFVYDRVARKRVDTHYKVTSDSICADGICTITSTHALPFRSNHVWYVRASNEFGTSTYTRTVFKTELPLAENPIPLSPLAGTILESNNGVNFSWSAVDGATEYDFFVYDRTVKQRVNARYQVDADTICNAGVCSITSTEELSYDSSARWYARASNSSGYSAYTGTNIRVGPM